jgi:hypothetical protein
MAGFFMDFFPVRIFITNFNMKKIIMMISTSLLAGQLVAQSGNKPVPPPPPPPAPIAMNAPVPPPPAPQLELDQLAPPPPAPLPPVPPKAPEAGRRKVIFVAPVIVKDKEIKPVK